MTRTAIGTIVPSHNRIAERTMATLLRHLPGVDSCIARIPCPPDGSVQPADAYDGGVYENAAWQLGHAGVAAVAWNGVRGGVLGLARDRALVSLIAGAAGCPATTTTLHAAELLGRFGARRIGILVPGSAAEAQAHVAGFAAAGIVTAATRGLGCPDYLAAAEVDPKAIAEAARALAAEAAPDALLIWSSNLPSLKIVAPLEKALGIPVLDGAMVGAAGLLAAAGIATERLASFGRVFALP